MEASANGYATRSRETCPDDDQRPGCGSRHGSTTLGRNILPLERDGLIAVEKGSRDCRSKAAVPELSLEYPVSKAGRARALQVHDRRPDPHRAAFVVRQYNPETAQLPPSGVLPAFIGNSCREGGTTRAMRTVIKPIGARAVGKVVNDDRADWREAWALFPGSVAYIWHAGTKAGIVQDSLAATRHFPGGIRDEPNRRSNPTHSR
jgi:hypothetical protein